MANSKKIRVAILASLIILVGNSNTAYALNNNIEDVKNKVYRNLTVYEKTRLYEYDIVEIERESERVGRRDIYKNGNINNRNMTIGVVDSGNKVKMERVLYHEIGHMIDTDRNTNKIGIYSNTEEFSKVYEKNKKSLAEYSNEYYFESDKQEFFAESFGMFLEDREALKRRNEEVYVYFTSLEYANLNSGEQMFITKGIDTYCIIDGKPVTGWVVSKKNGLKYYFSPIDYKMVSSAEIDGIILTPSGNEYVIR